MLTAVSQQSRTGQVIQAPPLGEAHMPLDIMQYICTALLDSNSALALGEVSRSWAYWAHLTQAMFHSKTNPMTPRKRQFLLNLIKNVFRSETLPSISHFAFKVEDSSHYSSQLSEISQHMRHLRTLKIRRSFSSLPMVVDLSFVGALANLRGLTFTGFKIISLSPLSHLTDLQSLDLSSCITDLTPLSPLTGLLSLDLSLCNNITDLTPLNKFTGLQSLDLTWCFGITSLIPLSSLTGLRRLDFSSCSGITDLTPLNGLTGLQRLYLSSCNGVADLAPLNSLTRLQSLDLNGCSGITDVTPLSSLFGLQNLDLTWCCGIIDLTPLSILPDLCFDH